MLFKQFKLLIVYAVMWQQLHFLQQAELGVEFITENYVVLHKAFSAPHTGCYK
jgi:hypothetical protein